MYGDASMVFDPSEEGFVEFFRVGNDLKAIGTRAIVERDEAAVAKSTHPPFHGV
jgi:molybdopterin biosynthesis enzyme MoaB